MLDEQLRFVRENLESIVLLMERRHKHTWDRDYPLDYIRSLYRPSSPELVDAALRTPEFVLYVHVPFCTQKCDFCHFYRPGELSSFSSADYVASVKAELEYYLRLRPDRKVLSVYFGGGTPTMLAPADLEDLLRFIRSRFDVAPDAWVTVETEPAYVTPEMAAALAGGGATDVVIGVQSFNEETLRRTNRRRQSNAQVHEAARLLRAAGGIGISLDLIYGLTDDETDETFLRDNLEHIRALQPETAVVYPLQQYQKHPELLSDLAVHDFERVLQAVRAAAPSTERRPYHSQYFHYRWDRLKDVLGVGLGARSILWPQGRRTHVNTRFTRENDFEGYRRGTAAGELELSHRSSPESESMRWYATWNLHRHGLDESLLAERFPGAVAEYRAMSAPFRDLLRDFRGRPVLDFGYAERLPFKTGNDSINYFLFSFIHLYSETMREHFVADMRAQDLPRARLGVDLTAA